MRRVLQREPYGFLDAFLRYERAREHLADVRQLVEAFKSTPQDVGTHIEAESIEELLGRERHDIRDVPIPYSIPIRLGETAYNFRCALDYLIFALAWHDSGQEPTGEWARWLQFPIEDSIKVFERRRATMLKGVSNPHVAMIREYQPAEGCEWTRALADINDSDKHRHLTVLRGSFDFETGTGTWKTVTRPHPDAVPDDEGRYDVLEVDMNTYATLDVVFPDGRLVSKTLEEIESQVRKLLLRFGREFRLRPV